MSQANRGLISQPATCLAAVLMVLALSSIGCKSNKTPQANTPATTPAAPSQAAQTQPAVGQASTQMSVDDLVAPVALYPDQLLGQLLVAATNSQEVLDLGNWLIQNQKIKPDAAPAAAKQAGFSTSAQYLAAFPQVVDNMCQELDWTKQLGDAFKNDQKSVMDAVQRKRMEAKQQGNLQSSPQMTVNTTTDNGQQVVAIAPANPDVVYVPQYNAETVYTTPAPQTTTVVQQQSGVSTGAAVGIGLLSFGLGMAVGSAFHHDDYYPYPAWGSGGMYYGGRPYYPPPYRAPAYAGYRPAYGYHPPSNYHWNQYNRQTNIKVNNNNYYGRYNNNNRPGAEGNTGYLGARNDNNRPGSNNQGNLRGQPGYQGARQQGGRNERPGASRANANPNPAGRNPGNQSGGRPGGGNQPGRNTSAGSPGRPGGRPASAGGDHGSANNKGATQNHAAAQNRTPQRQPNSGGNSAKSDRSASSRGHSSTGASAPKAATRSAPKTSPKAGSRPPH